MYRLVAVLIFGIGGLPCCLGFSLQTETRRRQHHGQLSARPRPREYLENGVPIVNLDDPLNDKHSLVAACDYSETFGPDKDRLTIDGERILYRNGRVSAGRWLPVEGRPVPHLYEYSENRVQEADMVIDKNGFAWRAQHVLRNKGLTRNNMEATHSLWRQLDETERNDTISNIQMPIPWNGPFNLPPRERGTGSNRKLRDDLQFGCELDDERWLVYYTKLTIFSSRFGHVNVPLAWEDDESLGRWVFKQRVLYRRYARNNYYQHEILSDGSFGRKVNPLSPWRIQMLYDIGFSFKINLRWHDRLAQLEQFNEKHGHVLVPSSDNGEKEEFPGLYLWIQSQRTEYRRWKVDMPSSMTKRRFVLLDRLGLDWDPLASMWVARMKQLSTYRAEQGHVRVSKTHDFELATWLIYVRSQYRIYQDIPWDSTLTKTRIAELEQLDMDWNPLESRWQKQFNALCAFHQQNGHSNVPVDHPDNPSLSLWVQKQRHAHKVSKMPVENEIVLRSIGFVFDPYAAAFDRGLEKLKAYKEEYGDCRVPRSYSDSELVSFVKQQRTQYRRLENGDSSSLTEERRRKMEELGFEWQVRLNAWDENYKRLRDFHRKHGHCNVPSDFEDQSLYRFVSVQRTQYNRLESGESQRLTSTRIAKLEALDFAWNTNDARWIERYTELEDFKEENRHCNVPDKYTSNPKLGSWVRNQRVQYRNLTAGKKSTMTPSRVSMLEKLGFEWSIRKIAKQ
jgi:hypothetical protein